MSDTLLRYGGLPITVPSVKVNEFGEVLTAVSADSLIAALDDPLVQRKLISAINAALRNGAVLRQP